MILVLGWIALGICTFAWLMQRDHELSPYWFGVFVLVYFGVPLLVGGMIP